MTPPARSTRCFWLRRRARRRACARCGMWWASTGCSAPSTPIAPATTSTRRRLASRCRAWWLTQVGRALARLGIEHIAAYSPRHGGARSGCSGRCRSAAQGAAAGGDQGCGSGQPVAEGVVWLADHNRRFATAPEQEGSAFVADRAQAWRGSFALSRIGWWQRQHDCVGGRRLQLPESRLRPHFVKARVRVHEYPDGGVSVFLGPHRLAGYTARGELVAVPIASSLASCSEPSRRGLATAVPASRAARRPSLTALRAKPPARRGSGRRNGPQVEQRNWTKTRSVRPALTPPRTGQARPACPRSSVHEKRTDHQLRKPDKLTSYRHAADATMWRCARSHCLCQRQATVLPGSCRKSMRPEEGAHVAHGQGNPVLGFLPGVEAHFGLRRKERRLHGHRVRVSRDVVR